MDEKLMDRRNVSSAWRVFSRLVPALAVALTLTVPDAGAAKKGASHKPAKTTVKKSTSAPAEKAVPDEKPEAMPAAKPGEAPAQGKTGPVTFPVNPEDISQTREAADPEAPKSPEPAAGENKQAAPSTQEPSEVKKPEPAQQQPATPAQQPAGEPKKADPEQQPQPSPLLQKILTPRPKPVQAQQAPSKAAQGGTAVLNFADASLKDILQTVAEITGENFILAPGVNAKISIKTVKPVPKSEVFGIFETILDLNGLAPVKTGSYYKIVPSQNAKQHNIPLSRTDKAKDIPQGDSIINVLVPLEFISANELTQVVKPMLSNTGSVAVYPRTNTLMVTDTATNLKKALDVIELLDVNTFQALNIELLPVTKVDANTLSSELNEIFLALGFVKDTTRLIIVPLERLNSVIVIASSKQLLQSAKEWIAKLDQLPLSEGTSIHTYYVQNDTASNLKGLLEQLYGGKRAASPAPGSPAPGAGGAKPAAAAKGAALAGEGSEDIKIYIYEPSNALIIKASQRDYLSILNTIRELDKPPKQVLIDAMIVEVTLDESTKYGIQWSALTGNFNIQQNTSIVTGKLDAPAGTITTPAGATAPAGLTAFMTDASKFFGVIQALASDGKVKVLSNPHIVVKNYEKASINIGSDEPVATQSTQTAVTGTAGIIQNIEYRKTGVILTVTSQVTDGGMVAMTVRQEVSNKSTDRTVGNAVYPSFSKREAETSVVSKDGETLVIGGLIEDKKDTTASGIPLLMNIPLLGNLFKFTSIKNSKTELVILLTARVIRDSNDAQRLTKDFKERLGGVMEIMNKGVK